MVKSSSAGEAKGLGSHVHCTLGPCFAQCPNYLTLMACELVISLKNGTKENSVHPRSYPSDCVSNA